MSAASEFLSGRVLKQPEQKLITILSGRMQIFWSPGNNFLQLSRFGNLRRREFLRKTQGNLS